MSSGIYKFENLINGKIYIGQAINLEEQYKKHLKNINDLSRQELLYQAIRKYGLNNFSYQILEQFEEYNPNQLNELEIYYIKQIYNSLMPNGYNMIPGGSNGAGLAKGKIVQQYTLKGEYIAEYPSAHQAAEKTGINYSSICACCREDISHTKQYQWKYKDSNKQIIDLSTQKIIIAKRKILQYNLYGELINEYESLADAVEKTHCSKAVISKVCNHKGWTAGGFFWCFKEDTDRINDFLKSNKCKLRRKINYENND